MQNETATSGRQIRVIFLHHSTGADILKDGNVRGLLREHAPDIALWDYAYNPLPPLRLAKKLVGQALGRHGLMPEHYYGLRDAAGRRLPDAWDIPYDNTDPWGLAVLFAQPETNPPSNAFSRMLQFDVIAFKPCFTILNIESDKQLDEYKQHYLTIRDGMDKHPDKLFLPLTPPPLRASLTNAEQARRSRAFASWIISDEYVGGRANVKPFDLFDLLAVPESGTDANTLRPEYCRPEIYDSHPNPEANKAVAARWVPALVASIRQAPAVMSSQA
jgi:hypothetical protein